MWIMRSQHRWWRHATIYHIYPRSFLDTNADGLGDLPGITSKIDYLRDLGIDAIWMGPIFKSPQIDNGYDIADYRAVDDRFGTNDDLRELIAVAHSRGIRVLLDLVFNHTSDQHRWFQASRNRERGYEDFYLWRDDPGDGTLPNDWHGFFSLPGWTWDEVRQQYYLHLFAPEQPDLNWDNPRVRQQLIEIANYWIDQGVDGFRLDVINMISKAPGLPSLSGRAPTGVFIDGPNLLQYLQEFRRGLKRSEEIVLVGETPLITPESAKRYTDPAERALDMVLLFDHLTLDHGPGGRWDRKPLEIQDLRGTIAFWQHTLDEPSWPSIYMSNHDQPRIVSRYGNDETYRFESAAALATVFYLQRGTPIVYQGDEIGMRNYPLRSPEEIADIESGNAYKKLVNIEGVPPKEAFPRVAANARDNSRTPMQWNNTKNAGFTEADEPWFPVNPDYPTWNVEAQVTGTNRTSGSTTTTTTVLAFYRRLLALRKSPVFLDGGFTELPAPPDSSIIAYTRTIPHQTIVVIVNLGDKPARWDRSVGEATSGKVLLSNYPESTDISIDLRPPIDLRPWEVRVIEANRE